MKLIDAELVLTMLKAFKDEKYGNPHFMNGIATVRELIEDMPEAVVRCKDCKYRTVNEHYGERGYLKLKAYCDLDTGDPFELGRNAEDDNWFCADGERRTDETD